MRVALTVVEECWGNWDADLQGAWEHTQELEQHLGEAEHQADHQSNMIWGLSNQLTKLQNLVDQLVVFQVALQHGPENLIEVEDDEEEEDAEGEEDGEIMAEVINLMDGEDDEPPTYVE